MRLPATPLLLLLVLLLAGCAGAKPKGADGAPALTAAFEFSPEIPQAGEEVRFLDRSTGAPTAWSWEFGDGNTSTEREPRHAFARAGLFEVRLVVSAHGRQDAASRYVQVGAPKVGPGGFGIDFRFAVEGLKVDFEPVPAPSGAVVDAYYWEFGDGEVSRESAPAHTYPEAGRYVVLLRAISGGAFANASRTVPVGVPGPILGDFANKSFAVVAVVDSGINPYHDEFTDPNFTEHPSTYIEGFPVDAPGLDLELQKGSFDAALEADDADWAEVKARRLYWIPGTRIVGAISIGNPGERRILDDHFIATENVGHGTMTASDAAGATIGTCPRCLLVVIEAASSAESYQEGLEWAMAQPWIDVITNSWQVCIVTCAPSTGLLPPRVADSKTQGAVERGVEIFFASGNGLMGAFDAPQLTYWNAYTGPDWIVTVGAADSASGATVVGTGRPVDIVSYGYEWKGASHTSTHSIKKFTGTSAASPLAAGAYASVVLGAREALNDTAEGPHGGVAVGPAMKGYLADGKLTRREAERALFLTASSVGGNGPISPLTVPQTAAAFTYRGYGLVNHATAKEALKVVLGERSAPDRSLEDQWAMADSQVRRAIWGDWNPGA